MKKTKGILERALYGYFSVYCTAEVFPRAGFTAEEAVGNMKAQMQ